jgi:hypothetical protein
MRAVALLMNIMMLLIGSAAVYWLSGVASPSLLAIHDRSASGKLRSSGAATPSEKSPIATTKGD